MEQPEQAQTPETVGSEMAESLMSAFTEADQNLAVNALIKHLSDVRNANIKSIESRLDQLKQSMPFLQKAITKD